MEVVGQNIGAEKNWGESASEDMELLNLQLFSGMFGGTQYRATI